MPFLVFVTAPDSRTARALARRALKERAAACANLLPGVESHYWWQGKLERSREILVLFKTTARTLPRLKRLVLAAHPYEVPEFIAVRLDSGSASYLKWIADSVR